MFDININSKSKPVQTADLWNTKATAEALRISEEALRRLCHDKRIAFYDIPGATEYFFASADITQFLASCRVGAASEEKTA